MPGDAPSRARILLASTPDSESILREALKPIDADVVCAFTCDAAKSIVAAGVDMVVCSLRFDESRMFDFIAEVGHERPQLPLVCCHVRAEIPEHSLRAAFTAAGYLGAVAVVDFPEVARREGLPDAQAALRGAVLAHLGHDVGHASMS